MHEDRKEQRRHRILEGQLKRQARKARRQGDSEEAARISQCLDDELCMEVLCAQVCTDYETGRSEGAGAGAGFLEFFTFLISNWESIAVLIEMITDLFNKQVEDE